MRQKNALDESLRQSVRPVSPRVESDGSDSDTPTLDPALDEDEEEDSGVSDSSEVSEPGVTKARAKAMAKAKATVTAKEKARAKMREEARTNAEQARAKEKDQATAQAKERAKAKLAAKPKPKANPKEPQNAKGKRRVDEDDGPEDQGMVDLFLNQPRGGSDDEPMNPSPQLPPAGDSQERTDSPLLQLGGGRLLSTFVFPRSGSLPPFNQDTERMDPPPRQPRARSSSQSPQPGQGHLQHPPAGVSQDTVAESSQPGQAGSQDMTVDVPQQEGEVEGIGN